MDETSKTRAERVRKVFGLPRGMRVLVDGELPATIVLVDEAGAIVRTDGGVEYLRAPDRCLPDPDNEDNLNSMLHVVVDQMARAEVRSDFLCAAMEAALAPGSLAMPAPPELRGMRVRMLAPGCPTIRFPDGSEMWCYRGKAYVRRAGRPPDSDGESLPLADFERAWAAAEGDA